MARYEHLPIYKKTYDISLRVMMATRNFPRDYKILLGQKLRDEITDIVTEIYCANNAEYKEEHIREIMKRIQAFYFHLRVAHGLKILPNDHYSAISKMTDDLSRQAQGWLKSASRNNSYDNSHNKE